MMKSDACENDNDLDLERGLPTTEQDVAVLKRLRAGTYVDPRAYLEFLARFPAPSLEQLRSRKGPRGVPFKL